jgi:hypothetical protein
MAGDTVEIFTWLSAQLGDRCPAAGEPRTKPGAGLTDKSVANRKLRTELGWVLKYPTFREGYAEHLAGSSIPA